MGLDISCYRNLVESSGREAFDDDGNFDFSAGWIQFNIQPEFTQGDNLCAERAYKAESYMGFRAGSYSSYGNWLGQLAELAGHELTQLNLLSVTINVPLAAMKATNGPFVELISFRDCEGVIGPQTSAKLARDFADYQTKADQHPDEYFQTQYRQWREAFEFAAVGGAVCFH